MQLAPGPKRRHRKGETKKKRGTVSWVHGTKLKFFEKRKDVWLKLAEKGDPVATGEFYTKMTRLYTIKYGYQLGDDEDLAVDVEDPPDEAADTVVHEKVAQDVADFRAQFYKTTRAVSGSVHRGNLL